MIGVEMIIYIDYLLLGILVFLSVFVCSYCIIRVYRLRRNGQLYSTNIGALLRPTKVLFTHKREGESTEELRTVVAYRNPFTGDYCVHKSRVEPKGYVNSAQIPDSPDSGVSDAYEPLQLEPRAKVNVPDGSIMEKIAHREREKVTEDPIYDNSVNKTWNWNYKEYQI
ncbi:uncharacterized protein LOC132903167 [Amyelois transitella]|uniref:uncharacterized protein LOC132903167 n=1 Tax=Amyelois transitella TaxID=680683 RepID=UPI00298F90FF|nr:uncharacterized protein LOC132903167 [Amyelois transitella]